MYRNPPEPHIMPCIVMLGYGGAIVETTKSWYMSLSKFTTVTLTLAPFGMYRVGSISPPTTKTSSLAEDGGCIPVRLVASSGMIAKAMMLMFRDVKVMELVVCETF